MQRTRYPGVHKLPDGRFRVRIKARDPKTGKEREVKKVLAVATAAEASRAKEELREELESGTAPVQRIRLGTYARSWLSGKLPTLKPSTSAKYASALDTHILPVLGDYYLDALEPADIVRWRDLQKGKATSINSRLRVLKTLVGDATAELGLPRDPTARVRALGEKTADGDPNRLTAEQLARVLDAISADDREWYALFLTLALTGTRVSEATALKWDDVEFDSGVIRIRRAHWKGIVGSPKTGSVRSAPLPDELAEVLKAHRRDLVQRQAPGLKDGWVFPSNKGTLIRGSSLRKPLQRALTKADITDRFTVHGFRRTFNNLMRQVASGEVVRSITGHVTERMTEHYSHVEAEEKQAAVSAGLQLVSTSQMGSGTSGGTSAEGHEKGRSGENT